MAIPSRPGSHTPGRQRAPFRPRLEALEDRTLLSFAGAAHFATGAGPYAIASGHFNADTALDLVTANYGGNGVSVLLNNGNGTFAAPVNYGAGTNPIAVVAADFNGDGRNDVAVANGTANAVNVLLNLGTGTLGPPTAHATGAYPISLAAGDFDGDGATDLAAANHSGHSVSVLLNNNNGTGTFRPGGTTATNVYPESVVAGDFTDGDAFPDLVTGSVSSGISTLVGNGDGTFDPPPIPVYVDPMSLAVGDLNEDGTLDLVGAASITYTYGGGGGGGYGYGYYGSWWYSSVTYGVVNVLIGNGDGTFNYHTSYRLPGTDPSAIAVADFNRDGWLDVAAAQRDFGVTLLLGEGTGALHWGADLAAGSAPSGLVAGDLDGDLFPDLAVSNQSSNNVSVLRNANDWRPWLTVSGASVPEGHAGTTPLTFTVRLSPGATQTVTVDYATADYTATAGSDYDAASDTLTFLPGGPLEQTVAVNVRGDTAAENYEYFRLMLSNAAGADLYGAVGWGAIADDEPYLTLEGPPSIVEGDSGTAAAVFTVRLSAPSTQTVTVDFNTEDYDALAGSDYLAVSETLTFTAGDTTQTIAVPIIGDAVPEWDEYFIARLGAASGALISVGEWWAGITDNEPYVSVEGPPSIIEGDSGTTEMVFTFRLSAPSTQTVTADFTTADYGALAGSDYVARAGTVTFGPGDTTQTVAVQILGDTRPEWDEGVSVYISGASGAHLGGTWSLGTILDDEPRLSVSDASVTEGDAGTVQMTFTVTLSRAAGAAVTVNYATANGSAVAGKDYTSASGTLTIARGETTGMISVTVRADTRDEYDEWFALNLTGGAGALIATSQGYGTIVDNDAAPTVRVNDVSVSEGRTGKKQLVFTVTLSAASGKDVWVDFETSDGTARTDDGDYVAKYGTLYFAPGETTKTITVNVKGDRRKEGNENFFLTLSGVSDASIGDGEGVGTILDDDKS